MAFELATHLGLVERSVETLDYEGGAARAVVLSRRYDTSVADLWDALTSPARLKRWFAPVSGELKLNGRFQVEGNASGTITDCVPEQRAAFTWEFGGGTSWVITTLTEEAGGARLELRHIAHISPFWGQFGPGAVGIGWDLGMMGLARHFDDPSAERPAEAEEGWATSEEAKGMYRITSADWGRAAIADGDEREAALAAAEASRQFYSGESPPG